MKKAKIFFLTGIWTIIILGMGHLLTHFLFMFSSNPKPDIFNKMGEFLAPVPGWEIDLLSLHNGFSIMMGILLIAIGFLGHHLMKINIESLNENKYIFLFFLVLSIIISIMTIKFFFVVPVVLSLLSTVSFSFAAILHKNKK